MVAAKVWGVVATLLAVTVWFPDWARELTMLPGVGAMVSFPVIAGAAWALLGGYILRGALQRIGLARSGTGGEVAHSASQSHVTGPEPAVTATQAANRSEPSGVDLRTTAVAGAVIVVSGAGLMACPGPIESPFAAAPRIAAIEDGAAGATRRPVRVVTAHVGGSPLAWENLVDSSDERGLAGGEVDVAVILAAPLEEVTALAAARGEGCGEGDRTGSGGTGTGGVAARDNGEAEQTGHRMSDFQVFFHSISAPQFLCIVIWVNTVTQIPRRPNMASSRSSRWPILVPLLLWECMRHISFRLIMPVGVRMLRR